MCAILKKLSRGRGGIGWRSWQVVQTTSGRTDFKKTWSDEHQQVIVWRKLCKWPTTCEVKHCGTPLEVPDAQIVSKSND